LKTHYEVLGLLPSAEDVVVKAAYKALAQKFHPDKNKNNKEHCTEVMARVNAAYGVLGDKEQRKKYDQQLEQRAQRKAKADKTREDKAKDEKSKEDKHRADRAKHEPGTQEASRAGTGHKAQAKTDHHELIDRLRHNVIDEVTTVKLYEEVFKCTVTINNGWVNTYTVKNKAERHVVDFARLKTQLLAHFSQDVSQEEA
jgi:curved DNA-binding protein CbpA